MGAGHAVEKVVVRQLRAAVIMRMWLCCRLWVRALFVAPNPLLYCCQCAGSGSVTHQRRVPFDAAAAERQAGVAAQLAEGALWVHELLIAVLSEEGSRSAVS